MDSRKRSSSAGVSKCITQKHRSRSNRRRKKEKTEHAKPKDCKLPLSQEDIAQSCSIVNKPGQSQNATSIFNVHQKSVMEKMQKNKSKSKNKKHHQIEKKEPIARNVADKRMKNIRKRLASEVSSEESQVKIPESNDYHPVKSTEANDYHPVKKRVCVDSSPSFSQDMECESIIGVVNQARIDVCKNLNDTLKSIVTHQPSYTKMNYSNNSFTVVVDTNILLSHIEIVDELLKMDKFNFFVMIPWRVFCELDNLKKLRRVINSDTRPDYLARRALSYLHENLPTNDKIIGQSLKDASKHLFPCETPDDEILNCCLQGAQTSDEVVLLSNDKNLCIKAAVNNIKAYTYEQLQSYIKNSNADICTNKVDRLQNNNIASSSHFEPSTSKPGMSLKNVHSNVGDILKKFLSVVLEEEMKCCYQDLWLNIVLYKPPWSIQDILECMNKHWIAVFSEVLPSEKLQLIKELKFNYPRRREVKSLSLGDMRLLLSSSIELVKSLQNNSSKKYSKLAADCWKSIKKINIEETSTPISNTITSNQSNLNEETQESSNMDLTDDLSVMSPPQPYNDNPNCNWDLQIHNTFELIWKQFINFCSLLANSLGVAHDFDDKSSQCPILPLVSQADSVAEQINLLLKNISRILLCNSVEETSPDYMKFEANEAADSFYNILKDTVIGMSITQLNFDKNQLYKFCSQNRKLLEDGFNKFKILHDLLLECSVKYTGVQM